MEIIIYLAIAVFGILQIGLFFKLWGMTNDIKDIRNKYVNDKDDFNTLSNNKQAMFDIGVKVKHIKSNKELTVIEFDSVNNRYVCYTENGLFEGRFNANELTTIQHNSSIDASETDKG